MAQIQKGYEYDSTIPTKNVVTDANLNSLVANATLLNGAIAEQFPNSSTADSDLMLLSKSGSLIKQTKGEFTSTINSNIANINTVNASLVDADDVDTVDATLTGNLAVGGNSALTGNLAITGNTTATGNLTVDGTANFTGQLQVDGANVKFLYEVFEETISPWSATVAGLYNSVYTSSSFTKPVGEIWVFELSIQHQGYRGYTYEFAGRYGSENYQSGNYLFVDKHFDSQGGGFGHWNWATFKWIASSAVVFTSESVRIDAWAGNGSQMKMFQTSISGFSAIATSTQANSKFRIYKYKNA